MGLFRQPVSRRILLAVMMVVVLLLPSLSRAQFFFPPFAFETNPAVVGSSATTAAASATNAATNVSKSIWDKIWEATKQALDHGAAVAFRNAARMFTQKIAYDTAVWISSGGKGQTPLFETKSLSQSVKAAADAAAGEFLDSFTQNSDVFGGFNVCTPTGPNAPQVKLIIGLTAFNEVNPKQPRCTLSQLVANWDKAINDPTERKNFLKNFKVALDPRQHDLGVALNVQQKLVQGTALKQSLTQAELTANQFFKPVTDAVTGFIKTPAKSAMDVQNLTWGTVLNEPLTFTGDVVADALGTFTNTLAARLLKRLMNGQIPNPASVGPGSIFAAELGSGTDYANNINTSIATPQIVGGDILDVISDFSTCPQNQDYASVNNCTIDSKFERVLRSSQEGKPLTVQEAVAQGLLNGNWVFKLDRPHNVRIPDAWYLSDIKKLRLARILPLGWELAAEKIGSKGVTLNEVMSGFAKPYLDSLDTNGNKQINPYYHLIDPNWIVKAPAEQCRLQGPGQILQPQGADRQTTCVDTQHCVVENPDGSCASWGYCTKEKNVWRLGGDSCELPVDSGQSPYATCQTFTKTDGTTVSYLQNSLSNLNDGVCSGAAGCRWYGTAYNPASATLAGNYNVSKRVYLKNTDKYSCQSSDEGCTSFLRLSNFSSNLTGSGANPVEQVVNQVTTSASANYSDYASVQQVFLKQAPDYLKCYDSDPTNDSAECTRYLNLCKADEVGCDLFTPQDGTPAVPGQPSPAYTCPAECVGYQAYQEQPTTFNPGVTTLQYFIASTGKTCPAEAVGCSEFTDVTAGETKAYFTQIRQCITPNQSGTTVKTYYTWQGSDLTGYQLRSWQLQAGASGGPYTTDSSGNGSICGQAGHSAFPSNPDCKQFYDAGGSVYYRFSSVTVTASANCQRYRKTESTPTDCSSTNGSWDSTTQACYYQVIPSEAKTCKAQYNGCREYDGPNSNSAKLVFPVSTFGDTDITTRLAADTSPSSGWYSGTPSNEAASAFGHSYDSGSDGIIYKDITSGLTAGQQYMVSFWAKKSNAGTVTIKPAAIQSAVNQTNTSNKDVAWAAAPQSKITPADGLFVIVRQALAQASHFALRGVLDNWSLFNQAWAQSQSVSLTASPSSFNNTGLANSFKTDLTWSASTGLTDAITVSIPGVLSTSFKADQRCANGGNKIDEPCSTDDFCRDLKPICQPTDFKCDSGLKKDVTCSANADCQESSATCDAIDYKCSGGPYDGSVCSPSNNNTDCRNTTATCVNNKCSNNNAISCSGTDATPCHSTTAVCQSTKKVCSNNATQTCGADTDCRYPSAQCLSTVSKCDSGFKSGQTCSVKDDCIDKTPVCKNYGSTSPKHGTLSVSLPTNPYSDYVLPVSKDYTLTVSYSNGPSISRTATVSVINPPGKFTITSPLDGATNQSLTPTIVWTASPRATSYDITISGVPGMFKVVAPNTQFTVPVQLSGSTNYQVTIVAKNDSSVSVTQSISFTTQALNTKSFDLYAPADDPATPEDEMKSMPLPFTIAWTASADAQTYLVTIYQDSKLVIANSLDASRLNFEVVKGQLKLGTSTVVNVMAYNAAGQGTQRSLIFTTLLPPQAFTVTSPGGTLNSPGKVNTTNPILSWTRSDYSSNYSVTLWQYDAQSKSANGLVQVGHTAVPLSRFNTSINLSDLTPDNGFTGLEVNRTYAWQVQATNDAGQALSNKGDYSYFVYSLNTNQLGGGQTNFITLPPDVGSSKQVDLPAVPSGLVSSLACLSTPSSADLSACPKGPFAVALSWADNSTNETGFSVYRGDNGQAVKLIALVGQNGTAFTDDGINPNAATNDSSQHKGLLANSRYIYQVRSYNTGGESKGVTAVVTTLPTSSVSTNDGSGTTVNNGTVYLKMTLNGQPVAGSGIYTIAGSTTGNGISVGGLTVGQNKATGQYDLTWISGGPSVTGATIYSIEANPGGSVACVSLPCGPVSGTMVAGNSAKPATLTFTVNYVAATASTLNPTAQLNFTVPSSQLGSDWQLYNLGPIQLPAGTDLSNGVRVQITSGGARFVIDNISLQEVGDRSYLVKNSWTTPASCQPGGDNFRYLGCRVYTDRSKNSYAFTGFAKICRQQAVGCEALVDTKNSESPRAATVTVGDQTITTPSDQVVYRVYDTNKKCSSSVQACTRVGEPQFNSDGTVNNWSDTFVKLNPDTFSDSPNSPLCSSTQDRCEAYQANKSTYYFKDPGNQTCEYKQLAVGQPYDWYRSGTSDLCNLLPNSSFENFSPVSGLKGSGIADDNIQDQFNYWERNGSTGTEEARGQLYAASSFNGQYWGSNILKVVSTPVQYSGVWSSLVKITPQNKQRLFLISAELYVPSGETLQSNWTLSRHAYPEVSSGCGGGTCHHYTIVAGNPSVTDADDKGVWLKRGYVIRTDPNIDTLSVGVITNEDNTRQNSTIYVDNVRLWELPSGLSDVQASEFLAVPPAYVCPADMSSCKAFRDPALTQKTYYYLDNGKIDRSSCSGKVGEKDGCLLFADLSQSGDLSWQTTSTYEQSRGQDNATVSPQSSQGVCSNNSGQSCSKNADCGGGGAYCVFAAGQAPDANTILKVQRDRVCAEWLSCQTSTTITDSSGKPRELCYSLGRCNQASVGNAAGGCGNWLDPQPEQHPLDETDYIGRNTTWSGNDYDGYSIPGLCSLDAINSSPACAASLTQTKACRLYPESDSPFPSTVATWDKQAQSGNIQSRVAGYKDANVCQPDQPGDGCECSYQRVTYKNGENRFYNYKAQPDQVINVPDGCACGSANLDDKCQSLCAEVSKLKGVTYAQGLKGYCLEKDSSRAINNGGDQACLTWLPIDVVQGEVSIYDDKPKAGFASPTGSTMYYCAAANGNAYVGNNGTPTNGAPYHLENLSKLPVAGPDTLRPVSSVKFKADGTVDESSYGAPQIVTGRFCSPDTSLAHRCENSEGVYANLASSINNIFFTSFVAPTVGQTFNPLRIGGYVDYDLQFSLGLSGLEKQLGGVQAIDSVEVGVTFRNLGKSGDSNNPKYNMVVSRFKKNDHIERYSCDSDGYGLCAAYVVFNPNDPDHYLSFRLVDMDPRGSAPFIITLKYNLREWCQSLAQVYDPSKIITNKAQTNRVNPFSNYTIQDLGYAYNMSSTGTDGYYYNPPFGAFFPTRVTDPKKTAISNSYDPASTDPDLSTNGKTKINSNLVPVFQTSLLPSEGVTNYAPAVYGCSKQGGGSCGGWMCLVGTPKLNDSSGVIDPNNGNRCDPTTATTSGFCGKFYQNKYCDINDPNYSDCIASANTGPYMCTGLPGGVNATATGGLDLLKNLFVKFFNIFTYSKTQYSPSNSVVDISGDVNALKALGITAEAPKVTAVVYDAKGKSMGESTAAHMSLSYSGHSFTSGDISGQSPLPVTLSFYGYNPNGNQMPLRFVGVNWGIKGDLGFMRNIAVQASLRNHKPYCQPRMMCDGTTTVCLSDNQCSNGKKCLVNPTYNFGDSDNACIDDQDSQAGYFFYTTTYTCSGKDSLNWDNNLQACVYQPGIALRDNWGWWSDGKYEDNPNVDISTYWGNHLQKYPGSIIVKPKD